MTRINLQLNDYVVTDGVRFIDPCNHATKFNAARALEDPEGWDLNYDNEERLPGWRPGHHCDPESEYWQLGDETALVYSEAAACQYADEHADDVEQNLHYYGDLDSQAREAAYEEAEDGEHIDDATVRILDEWIAEHRKEAWDKAYEDYRQDSPYEAQLRTYRLYNQAERDSEADALAEFTLFDDEKLNNGERILEAVRRAIKTAERFDVGGDYERYDARDHLPGDWDTVE